MEITEQMMSDVFDRLRETEAQTREQNVKIDALTNYTKEYVGIVGKFIERGEKRLARIALLTTNLTAEVSALMKRMTWPEELARLYLQHELNTLTTNTVSTTIRPQQ